MHYKRYLKIFAAMAALIVVLASCTSIGDDGVTDADRTAVAEEQADFSDSIGDNAEARDRFVSVLVENGVDETEAEEAAEKISAMSQEIDFDLNAAYAAAIEAIENLDDPSEEEMVSAINSVLSDSAFGDSFADSIRPDDTTTSDGNQDSETDADDEDVNTGNGDNDNDQDSDESRSPDPMPTAAVIPQSPETGSGSDTPLSLDTGSMPSLPVSLSHGQWTISANEAIDDDPIVRDWLGRLRDPSPELWKTFPNIPNQDVPEFRVVKCVELDPNVTDPNLDCVPDGLEYGEDESPYCEVNPCDIVTPAVNYVYISGDYSFQGMTCAGDGNTGCMLVIVNVMWEEGTYIWRDQVIDNGFRVMGRFWNGDALEWGVWGLVSHGSANMLNMPTLAHPSESLNFGPGGPNAGANCGDADACGSVNVRVVVTAGDRILALAETTVSRPS